ncbi:conserved hypothetical protein [Sporisorium reilianum SRZ2]|uniref:Uncharacterized protein n=1 Tax=Sporisorium reilianum (strain SRZ2) TaxID=999809 RepID=E6ZPI7_SPORE|nr:conserved hypothetical protein [Sporisorium reilianum SRZ2]
MSSIAFPAFERAQQEHMTFDRTAEQLYQSVEDAIRAPPSAPIAPEYANNDASHASASIGTTDASTSQTASGVNQSEAQAHPPPPKPKITKRVNARLQLAAALIEADNERILEKAQFWHIYHPPQAHDLVHPPPPPQPALASQSAIFAPFREGADIAVKRHVRTWSAATGLSRLLDPDDDGKRPSIDFLGVALPNEQRARSRAGSSVGALADTHPPHSRTNSLLSNAATSVLGRTSKLGSRPASLLGQGDDDDDDDDDGAAASDAVALSQWGVDKFLSKDERERIAGQRSRAQSLAGSTRVRSSFEQLAPSSTTRKSMDADQNVAAAGIAAGRASSEIVAPSTAAATAAPGDSKLELLAKIKLYRERQENLPPSEWAGPGPTAPKDQVVEHIIASADDNKRVSLREASRELSDASPPTASEQAEPTGSIMDRPRPSSRADSTTSSAFLTAPREKASADAQHAIGLPHSQDQSLNQATAATPSQAIPVPPMATTRIPSLFDEEKPAEAHDMVGVGSYSRSQSRRNSFLAGPLFNPHGESVSPSNGLETPAQMAQFAPQPHDAAPVAPEPVPFRQSRIQRRSWTMDQFAEHDLGLGPSPFAAALQAASPSFNEASELGATGTDPTNVASPAINFNGLSTRQLQNMARNSTFPSHLGINRDLLAEEVSDVDNDDELFQQNESGTLPKRRRQPSFDINALAQDLAKTGGDNFEIQLGDGAAPDLSSANWGKPRKKWFRLSMMMDAKGKLPKQKKGAPADGGEADAESDAELLDGALAAAEQLKVEDKQVPDLSDLYAAEPSANMALDANPAHGGESDGVDDDYVSPPRRGPLRPLGLAARTPKTIFMPPPLQGTELAPKLRLTDVAPEPMAAPPASNRHSLHVPEGFVLHNTRGGLPPMRSLVVHSANGPQPMFAAKPGNKKHEQVAARLKAVEVGRTVQVPAAAPRGIGRRAAAPTTALFRNHLVQHEDEREGWGFEAGTCVDDIFNPNDADDSDDDDKPLADIKKQSRSAKRAAKRLAKEKRKRKAARRIRRAKREEALKEGKSFREVGVDELSPDEDLDLSSTTSEEDVTDSETESDLWASDDDKRWIDDSKPAGKLYGKSLLDLATERTTERKSKARFYGQVQLEDGEVAAIQVDGDDDLAASQRFAGSSYDDAASVAPSVARSFRDKPLGFNDTRERMEAVFGADQIWAREMAKRQQDEARETEEAKENARIEEVAQRQRDAEPKAKKERGLFSLGKRSKKTRGSVLGISNDSAITSALSFTGSDAGGSHAPSHAAPEAEGDQAELPPRSQTPAEAPVIALDITMDAEAPEEGQPGRKSLNLLAGEEAAAKEWLISSDVESEENGLAEESSDDDVPLAQVKKNVASRPTSLAAGLSLYPTQSDGADSSDEELPLAALKEKRIRQSMLLGGGKLDLDFSSAHDGVSDARSASASSPRSGSVRETTGVPHNGVKTPLSQQAAVKVARFVDDDDDDSDEDLPLGQRHPGGDAALAIMRTNLENQKRALKETRQAEKAQRRAARLARQVSADDANQVEGEEAAKREGEANGADEDEESEDEDDDSEDDKPLGYVHPQAAIIAEQAALIRQLQSEKEEQQQQQQHQQSRLSSLPSPQSGIMSPSGVDLRSSMMMNRMSALPNMVGGVNGMGGMGMADPRLSMAGLPTNGSMMMGGMPQFDGLPTSSPGLPFSMSVSTPMQMQTGMAMAPGSQIGLSGGGMHPGGMSPAMSMPMQMGAPMTPNPMTMMLDPKASSIHNWRTQVPTDATATLTPPGGASAVNSG